MLRPRTPVPTTNRTTRSRRRSGSGRHPRSPWLEALEERELLTTFWVMNTNDSGGGSLRQAILDANTATGPDQIYFAIGSGVQTIRVVGLLPRVEETVTIDATTQPGYAEARRPMIELDGASGTGDGLVIQASDCEIRGLAVNHFRASGIRLIGGGHSTIQGCFLGVAPDGLQARGNSGNGLQIENSPDNTIGGADFGDGNLISGNGRAGIWIHDAADRTLVQGNLIGTDLAGLKAVSNGGWGIAISNGRDNTIGGAAAGAGNLISGNGQGGVAIYGGAATGNVVQGNLIGTDVNGAAALGNGYSGVYVGTGGGFSPPYSGSASDNTIGGTEPGAGNLISGNGDYGVWINGAGASGNVVQGNRIGTDKSGARSLGNALSGVLLTEGASNNTVGGGQAGAGNVISGNGQVGVWITDPGTSLNLVAGNRIGTNAAGAAKLPNALDGVRLGAGADRNTIGGAASGAGNVISGNGGVGIWIRDAAARTLVQGNLIGTDLAGLKAVSNGGWGIVISNGRDNTIGGAAAGAGNVVSGNGQGGVAIFGGSATGNVVQGNLIGADVNGAAALGNGYSGVYVGAGGGFSPPYSGSASNNTIGGTEPGAGNVISGNGNHGVWINGAGASGNVVQGNRIGTDKSGARSLGNALSGVLLTEGASNNTVGGGQAGAGNVISGNAQRGVDIHGAGTTGNRVQGNLIGTDVNGAAALANGWYGVHVESGAAANVVGTDGDGVDDASEGNVISGNAFDGVILAGVGTDRNIVAGNYIGTNAAGTAAVGNSRGILVYDQAKANRIGTDADGRSDILERNVISGNNGDGVQIHNAGTDNTRVAGNYIGTNAAGTAAVGNRLTGVFVAGGSTGSTIGGTADGQGNLISGNGSAGVWISDLGTSLNLVAGNSIGTNAAGAAKVPNALDGVRLGNGADRNTIGGTTPGARNVISGNNGSGVVLNNSATTANVITGNFIGANAGGTAKLGNAAHGVVILGGTTNNTVGGTTSGSRNVIAGNGGHGVYILGGSSANRVQGNSIGTDLGGAIALGNASDGVRIDASAGNTIGGATTGAGNTVAFNGGAGVNIVGSASTGDAIEGNAIFSNARLGIDLGGDGATANHATNPASGPNRWQNTPLLTTAVTVGGTTTVQGSLASAPSATFRVEVFADLAADPSGFGQGRTFLGALTVTTDAAGFASFNWSSPTAVTGGHVVSATATSAGGDTSEFSRAIKVLAATTTTVSSSAPDATYGQTLTFTAIVGSLAPGNGIPTGTVQFQVDGAAFGGPVALVGGMATSAVVARMSAGTHTIVAVYSGDAAALGGTSAGLVQVVAKAHLIVTADAASVTYGAPTPALAATITGFVPGEDAASAGITGSASLFTTADGSSPAGAYPIVAGVGTLAAANYDFLPVDGTLVVTPAPLTVTADDVSVVYGSQAPTFTVHYSGFVAGDSPASLGGSLAFATPATAASGVARYAVSVSGLTSTNYAITFVPGVLDVTPAPLTVRADDKTRTYGAANPTLTATYIGFVNGDTAAGLTTPVSLSTLAGAPSHVGVYPIIVSGGGSPNYSITLAAGVLTVSPALLVIAADDTSKVYAQPLPPLTVSYSGFVNGEGPGDLAAPPTVSTAADALSPLGTYPIRAAGATSPDYLIRYVDGSLAVRSVDVQSDPLDASRRILVVGGTSGNDKLKFIAAGGIRVDLNGVTLGVYDGISGLVAFGGPGDDSIRSSSEVTLPTVFFGGEGDDQLEGGGGDHALVGGAGGDRLDAGRGRSVLIGGAGADQLQGLQGDTILIAGSTRYDLDVVALEAILAEWGSVRDYQTRVANLSGPAGGPRSNGDVFLVAGPVGTVLNDQGSDVLEGGSGLDWYFADLSADPRTRDSIRRLKKGEAVTRLDA